MWLSRLLSPSVEERKGRDDDYLSQSVSGMNLKSAINVARSTSIKEEKRKKGFLTTTLITHSCPSPFLLMPLPLTAHAPPPPVGVRSRANTGTFLPNWIRRRKGLDSLDSSPSSPSSATRMRQRPPVESIAEMFNRFVNTANKIEPDSFIVSWLAFLWFSVVIPG